MDRIVLNPRHYTIEILSDMTPRTKSQEPQSQREREREELFVGEGE